jgi:hypothetical protein
MTELMLQSKVLINHDTLREYHMKLQRKIGDCGIILLLLVIAGQIIATFLVVRISITNRISTVLNLTLIATAGSGAVNVDGKTWHDAESWTINLQTTGVDGKSWHDVESWTTNVTTTEVTSGSSNYLIALKEEDKSDLDDEDIKRKDVERLNAKLRKMRRKIKRIFQELEYIISQLSRLTGVQEKRIIPLFPAVYVH